jgi:Predicted transcriptional regulators
MNNRVKIGDFVKLTGSTLKTVKYYHKIGLLQEPERSAGGYRLYGPEELDRMQAIKHLKYLGMDLRSIKEVLVGDNDSGTLRDVLDFYRKELLIEKKNIEDRLQKIENLLREEKISLDDDKPDSSSFQMITDILGQDNMGEYAKTCPELWIQHQKIYGILDSYQWGEDYKVTFRELAEFFKAHPRQYEASLKLGVRLSELAELQEDDPEVDALAHESAEFIKRIPQLKELLTRPSMMKKPFENIYGDMVSRVVPPAQRKHGQLLLQYLLKE